ncbi:MAG: histidine phosphatase family protein [Gammaproteobacteria bacterium]|nr:histidine phosphatase family protein [Pseudomonadales bacterium]MCP5346917.1 histidine phosphatase family protein [Pseudomonadales bacterium]
MLVHLIRHGETDWNAVRRVQGQKESQLSPLGRQQALQLAAQLATFPISRVYCSSSIRTRETAAILFRERSLETSYHDSLREIHLGPWEGSYYDDLAARDPEQFHNFWHCPDRFAVTGAETFQQLQLRGMQALESITDPLEQDEIAIVSHGALLKAMLCHFEGRHLSRLWEPPRMANCAHSILQLDAPGRGQILQYAGVDYRHLGQPLTKVP